ncbi:hypothetical protein IGI04_017324 [Brassica rapa subsp. trilocularis]|uniref:SKP1 component dimerisation domain-containing protein n=1 Tax=Brassica rapa subsp. trilocularis TaxID=1813537 RepID=A0ABQ7MAW8_BRACM|nr:hypothetical protein IGI04_017324 [Brassica rapa subsp. trilocularis]
MESNYGDRYEEGDITPRPMMKFKAAGADVWDPKWDAHPIGGGAKKMLTREELFERANPVDDPRPLLTMKDILDDLLELPTIDLFSIKGPICEEVVEKLQMLYGLWESGDADDKRSTPKEDYMEWFKRDRRFQGI